MKTTWTIVKDCGKLITELFQHKICFAFENRKTDYIRWSGEFDNDNYFMVVVVNGIMFASCGEREMMLESSLKPIAYASEVSEIMSDPNEISKLGRLLVARTKLLPALMKEFKFDNVMKIFKWEYASDKVSLCENLF